MFCIIILLLISFCRDFKDTGRNLKVIDIASNVRNFKELYLSQFTDEIRYIPLKTNENEIFVGIWDCVFTDKYFLAKDIKKCILYDYDGNIIAKIGNQGRGPGEYQFVINAAFGYSDNIYIQSLYDLYEYRIDGSFIRKYRNIFLHGEDLIGSWLLLNDSTILGKITSSFGNEENKAIVFSLDGRVNDSYKNYIKFKRDRAVSSQDERHADIYNFHNEIFFKEPYNDTLFYLTERELEPRYVIRLGKYHIPVAKRLETISSTRKDDSYIFVKDVLQTPKYQFLICFFGDFFPAKRITPRIIWNDITSEYNTRDVLGIYDKMNHKLLFCKPSNTDNPLYASGLFNDIDAGPKFLPQRMVNDSVFAMWVDAKKMKDHVASDDFKNTTPKYSEKKKGLEKLAKNLKETDNPVLMLVMFNK